MGRLFAHPSVADLPARLVVEVQYMTPEYMGKNLNLNLNLNLNTWALREPRARATRAHHDHARRTVPGRGEFLITTNGNTNGYALCELLITDDYDLGGSPRYQVCARRRMRGTRSSEPRTRGAWFATSRADSAMTEAVSWKTERAGRHLTSTPHLDLGIYTDIYRPILVYSTVYIPPDFRRRYYAPTAYDRRAR